ncbi:AhpC/TSA family protein [Lacibacter luteus]|uniref:AhpC/TSA family protein n=1 Tax=Lacibacter luteus TaxID=2508719 RepID=A0A4Q1CGP3_9BACT|nr:TlpA disulfide reductase family protein [Lacibacter luteus]RXK59328.1 AhpC/TSA family protein [Lacibacter luteus]
MRKYLSAILFAFVTTSLSAQIKFTIVGKIAADTIKEISIQYNGEKSVIPVLKNGTFSFEGDIKSDCSATIIFNEDETDVLWLDSGKIEMTIEQLAEAGTSSKKVFKITSVKGPKISESYFNISKVRDELYKSFDNVSDTVVRNSPVYNRLFLMIDQFVTEHPKLNLSIEFIRLFGLNFREKEVLLNKLDKGSEMKDIEVLASDIERERKLAPGNVIDDFTMAKSDGSVFQLSKVQSQYVLLEFWSSWCAPCRAMRPRLSGMYKKYHEKGLEIVGVSVDERKTDWIKAIEKDNVQWIEVSDLKGFKNSFAYTTYKINAIPYWILIDKNRKVIQSGIWSVPEQTLQKLMP